MRYFVMGLLLLASATASAQPLPDPFVVMEADSQASFSGARVTMRDSVTADVFYLESRGTVSAPDNRLRHAVVSLSARQVIAGPQEWPTTNDWNLMIGDVASRGADGWIALIYEVQGSYQDNWSLNRTSIVYGQDRFQQAIELDTGRTQEFEQPPFYCDIAHRNVQFSVSERVGGGWILSWLRYGCQVFPGYEEVFPLNSIQLVSLSPDLSVDHRKSCCSGDYDFGPCEVRSVSADHDTAVVLSMDWRVNGGPEPYPVLMKWQSLSGDCTMSHFPGAVISDIERTRSGRFLALSPRQGGMGALSPLLLELDRVTGRTTLDTLPFPGWNPTDFHSDFGFAFLKVVNHVLMLARIDTTGEEVQPIGVFCETDGAHTITQADVAITPNGRVVVLWGERQVPNTACTTLKMAWVDWTTYLGVQDRDFILHPSSFSLSCFPNPFNARTEIRFSLPQAGKVSLDLFNVTGRKVATLFNHVATGGEHTVPLDATGLASGVYFVSMEAAGKVATHKILLLK